MIGLNQLVPPDLGIEPKEVLGFETEEELELAILPLMKIAIEKRYKQVHPSIQKAAYKKLLSHHNRIQINPKENKEKRKKNYLKKSKEVCFRVKNKST